MTAGRSCPRHYYYGAEFIAKLPRKRAKTLYVVGGLYGNHLALDEIQSLVSREKERVTLAFNGDFNWFNVDARSYVAVNNFVLAHDASLGNVEIELFSKEDSLGCGCAYPDYVADDVVARSNDIHRILRQRATMHPYILQQLSKLSMVRCYRIGTSQVAVIHGDSSSLAGWSFGAKELQYPLQEDVLLQQFMAANVNIFASTHTCLPVLKRFNKGEKTYSIINNGSAGMPNFHNAQYGIITRISTTPSPHFSLYGYEHNRLFIDAIAVHYDHEKWVAAFQENWPKGSPASESYLERICKGPDYQMKDVVLATSHVPTENNNDA